MTEFEEKVVGIVRNIPKGKVSTYGRIAKKLKNPGLARAVGNVVRKAPLIDSSIPCHRVIKTDGRTGKYRFGRNKKIQLLKKEGVEVKDGRVNLEKFIS